MIGVVRSSSLLMTSSIPGAGLLGSSEGNVAVDGVFSAGSAGLGDRGALMMGTVGVGVGAVDDTGDTDDDVDPSVAVEGGDEASEEAGEVMLGGITMACCQLTGLNRSDGTACGGQRMSRGSNQRKERATMPAIVEIYGVGTGIESNNDA